MRNLCRACGSCFSHIGYSSVVLGNSITNQILFPLQVKTNFSGSTALMVDATAGQTADIFQVRNNAGTALVNVSAGGNLGIGGVTPGSELDLNGAFSVRGMAAPAVSPAGQGRIYFDSTSKKFLVSQDGGAYVDMLSLGSGTGTVSYIGAGTGLTGGPITSAGTLSVDVGTGANQIVQLDGSSRLPAVNGSLLTSVNAIKIAGSTLSDLSALAGGDANKVLRWDGSKWVAYDPQNDYDLRYVNVLGDTLSGNIDMGGHTITNLASPVANSDAVRKDYLVDVTSNLAGFYVQKAGDSMSGHLWVGSSLNVNGSIGVNTTATGKGISIRQSVDNSSDGLLITNAGGTWSSGMYYDSGLGHFVIRTDPYGAFVDGSDVWLYTNNAIPIFPRGASFQPAGAAYRAVVASAAAGQTANIQEWTNSGGTALSAVDKNGSFGIGTATPASALDVNGAHTIREIASGSAPAPAAGKDFIYADNSSHTLKASLNGGAYEDLLTSSSTSGNYVLRSGDSMSGALTVGSSMSVAGYDFGIFVRYFNRTKVRGAFWCPQSVNPEATIVGSNHYRMH